MILYFSGGSEIVETESDPKLAAVMMSYYCHTTKKNDPASLKKRPNSRMRKILVIRRNALHGVPDGQTKAAKPGKKQKSRR